MRRCSRPFEPAALALPVADRVLDELQLAGSAEVREREDAREDGLQARLVPLLGEQVHLQETLVGPALDVDQVRKIHERADLREVLPLVRRQPTSCHSQTPRRDRRRRRGPPRRALARAPVTGEQQRVFPSRIYLISTFAPTSSNFFLIAAASSLETPSFRTPGAPSTRSLASFRPRLVTSRTTLIVLILSPAAARMTVNSVFSSSTGAAAARRARRRHRHRHRRRRDAELLLERLDEGVELEDRHALDFLDEVLRRHRHDPSPLNVLVSKVISIGGARLRPRPISTSGPRSGA